MGGMLRGGSHQGNKKRQKQEKTQIREEEKKRSNKRIFSLLEPNGHDKRCLVILVCCNTSKISTCMHMSSFCVL